MLIFQRKAIGRIATLNAEMGTLIRVVLLFIMLHSTAEARALPFRKSNGIDFVITTARPSKRYVTVEPLLVSDETVDNLSGQKKTAKPISDQNEAIQLTLNQKNTVGFLSDKKEIIEASSNISVAKPTSPAIQKPKGLPKGNQNEHVANEPLLDKEDTIQPNSVPDFSSYESEEQWELWQIGYRSAPPAIRTEARALPSRKSNGIDFVITTARPSKQFVPVQPLLVSDETVENLTGQKKTAEPLTNQDEAIQLMLNQKNTAGFPLDKKEIIEASSNISVAIPTSPAIQKLKGLRKGYQNENVANEPLLVKEETIKPNSVPEITSYESEEQWELWQIGDRSVVMAAPRAIRSETDGAGGSEGRSTDYKLTITVVAQAFVILCGLGMVVSYKLYHNFKGKGSSTDSEPSNSVDEPSMFHRRPSLEQHELDTSPNGYLDTDAFLGPLREAWTPESQLSAVESHVTVESTAMTAATPTDRMGRLVSTMMRNDSDFVINFRDNADTYIVPSLRVISPSSSCCHSDKILTPRTAAAGNRFIIPGAIGSDDSITTLDPAKMVSGLTATSPDHLNAANTYWERSASADYDTHIIQHYINEELMARKVDKTVSLYQFK